MKRPLMFACLVGAMVPLGGCVDHYRGSAVVSWSSYPYYGWYDGFYGPIYDGYWGTDSFFYFRLNPADRVFRRGDAMHFRREATPRFQRFEGDLRPPPQGTRMPRFEPQQRQETSRDRRRP